MYLRARDRTVAARAHEGACDSLSGRCLTCNDSHVNVGGEPPAEFAMWKLRRRRRRGHARRRRLADRSGGAQGPGREQQVVSKFRAPGSAAPARRSAGSESSDCVHASSEFSTQLFTSCCSLSEQLLKASKFAGIYRKLSSAPNEDLVFLQSAATFASWHSYPWAGLVSIVQKHPSKLQASARGVVVPVASGCRVPVFPGGDDGDDSTALAVDPRHQNSTDPA